MGENMNAEPFTAAGIHIYIYNTATMYHFTHWKSGNPASSSPLHRRCTAPGTHRRECRWMPSPVTARHHRVCHWDPATNSSMCADVRRARFMTLRDSVHTLKCEGSEYERDADAHATLASRCLCFLSRVAFEPARAWGQPKLAYSLTIFTSQASSDSSS